MAPRIEPRAAFDRQDPLPIEDHARGKRETLSV